MLPVSGKVFDCYLYLARSGSLRNSLSNMPSVMYLMTVLSDVQSSNLML